MELHTLNIVTQEKIDTYNTKLQSFVQPSPASSRLNLYSFTVFFLEVVAKKKVDRQTGLKA